MVSALDRTEVQSQVPRATQRMQVSKINCDNGKSEVRRLVGKRKEGLITRADAVHEALPLILEFGPNVVLDKLDDELRQDIRNWVREAPKTQEAWLQTKVFEQRAVDSGVPEFIAVPMSEGEADARLQVIRDLLKYFEETE